MIAAPTILTLRICKVALCIMINYCYPDMVPELHYVDLITWKSGKVIAEFRLINFISTKCDKISTQLQVPKQVYDVWVKKNNFGDACHDMIQHWLESGCGPYPVTWNGMIQVLRDVELGEVAKQLKRALLNKIL